MKMKNSVPRCNGMMKDFYLSISGPCPLSHNTVEPGHLRTEGIVPYSEVVPYWEVFQKKKNNDVKSLLKNRELVPVEAQFNIKLLACVLYK